MRFSGEARLEGIAEVVAAVKKIPVVGNGDVRTPEDAKRMMEVTGCHGVMIGRGALGRPWLFRQVWEYLTTGVIPPVPSVEERCQMIRDHFYHICRFRNEWIAVCEFRKRISWYARNMGPCRRLRDPMRKIKTASDFDQVLHNFLEFAHNVSVPTTRGCSELSGSL